MSKYRVIIFSIFSFLNLHSMEEKNAGAESFDVGTIINILNTTNLNIREVQKIILSYCNYLLYKEKDIFLNRDCGSALAFSHDNKLLALLAFCTDTPSFNVAVTLFDVESNEQIQTISFNGNLFERNIAFTPDNRIVLFEHWSSKCTVWDLGSEIHNRVLKNDNLETCDFSQLRSQICINNNRNEFYSPDETLLAKIVEIKSIWPLINNHKIQIYKLGSSYKHKSDFGENDGCAIL